MRNGRTAKHGCSRGPCASLFLFQLAAGTINVLLLAPVWMQIVHLFLADLVWISAILFAAAALSVEVPVTEPDRLNPIAAQAGD